MGFGIDINEGQFDALCDGLTAAVEDAARPAAQAAAQVLYDEVQRNVRRIRRRTGNLAASIYQAYSRDNSGPARATYHISWNARKAPHGHLVEFGHFQRYEVSFDRESGRFITHLDRPLARPKKVAARPFIRPAQAAMPRAIEAAKAVLFKRLDGDTT